MTGSGRVLTARLGREVDSGLADASDWEEAIMRTLVYHGPKNVSVDEVSDATVERPTDALIRFTTTNIYANDLHR